MRSQTLKDLRGFVYLKLNKMENVIDVVKHDFTCKSCENHLPIEFNVRTVGFCYLCDPNITVKECLSDEPFKKIKLKQ